MLTLNTHPIGVSSKITSTQSPSTTTRNASLGHTCTVLYSQNPASQKLGQLGFFKAGPCFRSMLCKTAPFLLTFLLKIDSTGTHTDGKKRQLHLAHKLTTGVASGTLTKANAVTRIDGLFFIFESSFFVFRSRAVMERALIGLIGQLFEGHPVSFLCVSNANTDPMSELRRWAHVSFKCDQLDQQSRKLCSQSLGVQTFWRFS